MGLEGRLDSLLGVWRDISQRLMLDKMEKEKYRYMVKLIVRQVD